LEDPAKADGLVSDAVAMGATDLFVQVYRAGKSWFPSERADPGPWRAMNEQQDEDPLPRLIVRAHAAGLRVHAWFNVLSLARNREAPLLRSVGPRAVLVDRRGRSLLDYPGFEVPQADREHTRMGTPGVWLDPATPGVIEYVEATLADLVAAAPDLDGLHLDFIRHPMALPLVPGSRFVGLDFGYGEASVARYEQETGRRFAKGDDWDAFRRARVSEVVRRMRARVPPDWEVSAAVLPWADRAYLTAMQDWRAWLEDGSLDFAVAMIYTRDDRLLRYVSHGLAGGIGGDRVWLGLGTWLFVSDPARTQKQIDLALAAGPAGIALFSYDALVAERPTLEAIRWGAP
jgi:uncharacterized lipoprotein YddW (UPF0748 family)